MRHLVPDPAYAAKSTRNGATGDFHSDGNAYKEGKAVALYSYALWSDVVRKESANIQNTIVDLCQTGCPWLTDLNPQPAIPEQPTEEDHRITSRKDPTLAEKARSGRRHGIKGSHSRPPHIVERGESETQEKPCNVQLQPWHQDDKPFTSCDYCDLGSFIRKWTDTGESRAKNIRWPLVTKA